MVTITIQSIHPAVAEGCVRVSRRKRAAADAQQRTLMPLKGRRGRGHGRGHEGARADEEQEGQELVKGLLLHL